MSYGTGKRRKLAAQETKNETFLTKIDPAIEQFLQKGFVITLMWLKVIAQERRCWETGKIKKFIKIVKLFFRRYCFKVEDPFNLQNFRFFTWNLAVRRCQRLRPLFQYRFLYNVFSWPMKYHYRHGAVCRWRNKCCSRAAQYLMQSRLMPKTLQTT